MTVESEEEWLQVLLLSVYFQRRETSLTDETIKTHNPRISLSNVK